MPSDTQRASSGRRTTRALWPCCGHGRVRGPPAEEVDVARTKQNQLRGLPRWQLRSRRASSTIPIILKFRRMAHEGANTAPRMDHIACRSARSFAWDSGGPQLPRLRFKGEGETVQSTQAVETARVEVPAIQMVIARAAAVSARV